jgi:FAD/FMN-containing dehydrogenase/Fe-S oxidoreductase
MPTLGAMRESREAARFARQRREEAIHAPARLDVRSLERALRDKVRGEVRFDDGSRALYATDASNYRQVPIGVVLPRDIDDVIHTVAACREHQAPLLSRGGGTSLAGQCCNVAMVMDFSKYMHRVLEIDPDRKLARVEPGCVLDDLRRAAEAHHLTFGPDPATHTHCTIGGMLGNNSCGVHSLLSRNDGLGLRTSDNTHELAILTYDGKGMRVGPTAPDELRRIIEGGGRRGRIYAELEALRDKYAAEIRTRFPTLPRRISGFNLDELLPERGFHVARALVGTESTCVTILEATLHLVPSPPVRSLLVLGYPDIFLAADHVIEILEYRPIALEGMDRLLFEWVRNKGDKRANLELLPAGGGWLMVEFGGESKQEADEKARRLMAQLERRASAPAMKLYDDPVQEEMIWKVREGGLGSTAWIPGLPDTWEGWEDSAVPPDRMGAYLRGFADLLKKYDYTTALYGHLGQGCIHCRIPFDFYSTEGIRKYRSFMEEATELVLRHGGSLSGEHGDGQSRAEFLPKMFGETLVQAFREFKAIWDPGGRMNPGKVVDPYSITDNLRIGADYNPPAPPTHFRYPADRGAFSRAVLRCVGVGECRRESGGTMCPSYMATREEMHSTRGRARLLWEMLNGEMLNCGWRSGAVKEALDLCLGCKGCKNDCPVGVDMATYKAEFFSHYYAGRMRPRHAYAFGLIHLWARLASRAPELANLATRLPLTGHAAKWLAGMAPERRAPLFAPETFRTWFRRRAPGARTGLPVVLWPDTFTDHFHPDIGKAAVEVLERAGFRVKVPQQDLCCGRPLYDYGFLGLAQRWLRHILEILQPAIEAGLPFVVLEPSCAAVFRDELSNLFPNDHDAERLSRQTFLLSEFLEQKAPEFQLPRLERKALVHGHCHHKSIMGMESEERILQRMGLEVDLPEAGCCGMAGAFGFERGEHYEVSLACGERVLLPRIRETDDQNLIVADGFSCRTQISQATGREALHLAQVIQLALRRGLARGSRDRPEAEIMRARRHDHIRAALKTGALLAGGALAGGALWWTLRDGGRNAVAGTGRR